MVGTGVLLGSEFHGLGFICKISDLRFSLKFRSLKSEIRGHVLSAIRICCAEREIDMQDSLEGNGYDRTPRSLPPLFVLLV